MARLVALVLALAVFIVFAQTWHRYAGGTSPSPVDAPPLWEWVKRLVSRDPGPEPGPEPGPRRKGYRLVPVDDAKTVVEWPTAADLPPAMPVNGRPKSPMQQWVAASLDQGARYGQILAEGQRLFSVSESTMKREIRKARNRP